jgi:hypothetical protein
MYRVELTFGHRQRDGTLLPATDLTAIEQHILDVFSNDMGGGQAYYRAGGYLNTDGHLTIEPCTVVLSFAEAIDRHITDIWHLARAVAERLEQECVLVTITPVNGLVLMVKPD